jgi:putative restriction endonuclease
MKFWVGITDNSWFNMLSDIRPDEVNFWQPGGSTNFKAIPPGAPFLFKLHSPQLSILPASFSEYPSKTFLEWHNSQVYRG